MSSNLSVHCSDVKKTYAIADSNVWALRGVNLDVYKGELLILAGPSGCGKTTLISVISGILKYDSGQCIVFNQNLSLMDEASLTLFRSQTVGFVFQLFNLIPTLTISQNVSIPLIINGMPRQEAFLKATEVLRLVGLEDKINHTPFQLSGGQQQRVAIARSIVHNPKLVVCDEPTSALDGENGKNIMNILRTLVQNTNKSVIVVTHDNRIFDFADRIVFMEDGRIKGESM